MIFVTKPTPKAKDAESRLKILLNKAKLDPNIIAAIGGDGTMLHAIRQYVKKGWPFVGVSAGRLGFLQAVETEQLEELVKALRAKVYNIIEAPLLAAKSDNKLLGYAFNDISLERSSARAAKFGLHVGESVGTFIGDGLIFATPLGSTAYNLAAAGPIIDSSVQDIFIVTPNNPHFSSLYSSLQRPHVLSRLRHVKVQVDSEDVAERPTKLVMDGNTLIEALDSDVEIYLSNKTVKLIELNPDGFHHRIENKRLGRY